MAPEAALAAAAQTEWAAEVVQAAEDGAAGNVIESMTAAPAFTGSAGWIASPE